MPQPGQKRKVTSFSSLKSSRLGETILILAGLALFAARFSSLKSSRLGETPLAGNQRRAAASFSSLKSSRLGETSPGATNSGNGSVSVLSSRVVWVRLRPPTVRNSWRPVSVLSSRVVWVRRGGRQRFPPAGLSFSSLKSSRLGETYKRDGGTGT